MQLLPVPAEAGTGLKFHPTLAGALGHGRDPPVVHEAVPVEHDRGDLRFLALLRHQLAHFLGQLLLLPLAVLELGREGGRRGQRLARRVVDHLRIDVVQAAVHREPRALLRTLHPLADVRLAAQPQLLLLHVGRGAHLRGSRLALLAADGFLGVLDALALVGLGRAQLADLRRDQADAVLVGALHGEAVALGVVLRGDAFRQRVDDRMREADGEVDLLALQRRLVADPRDVQRAREPLRDAQDHVGDQRPRQAVELARAARVVGSVHADLPFVDGDLHLPVELLRDLALGALDVHEARLGGHLDLVRNLDGELADARHGCWAPYQTVAISSPPRCFLRAWWSTSTPLEVERIAIPRPFSTLGMSVYFT